MSLMRLQLKNVGQIREADLRFGDLTVFVGPQATGKSIALQILKLYLDAGSIREKLRVQGIDWDGKLAEFLDVFLGEGMRDLWKPSTEVLADNESVNFLHLIRKRGPRSKPSLFFVPAQRVLTLRGGWPRPFSDYGPGDPFSVRDFSEELRKLMEGELGRGEEVFPRLNRLKAELRDALTDAVFHGFNLRVDKVHSQKRLVLGMGESGRGHPFMVWSAGQREFVPLLLGLYWLLPSAAVERRKGLEWVVIEEPEMGLHPKAVNVVMLLVLELLGRGYRVCLSTHSPQVLDILWALRVFRDKGGTAEDVLNLFGCKLTSQMKRLAKAALRKTQYVHFFRPDGTTRDISALDPGAEDVEEAGWGGLSEFSGRVGERVAEVVSRSHQEGAR